MMHFGSCGSAGVGLEGDEMPEHRSGTREEWQVARGELAKLEAEQAERNEEITRTRRDLPWVRVETEYEFDTEDGKRTLAELFDGRSQLLAYNIMYGPDYTLGACPGCTSLCDWLEEWSGQIGAELKDGLRENPSWIAFAHENGTVYHTYTVSAPDPFVAPYYNFLLERTPKAQPAEPRTWRKDEYPD